MPRMIGKGLSRREREILDILHANGQATASEVHESLPDAPTYSAVRSTLRILEEKGHIRHQEDGKRYVYVPTEPRQHAGESALRQVMQTFFGGSLESAVRTFLSDRETSISDEELERLRTLIEQKRSGAQP